jgi:2-keto-4-pentenoate hydratase
MGRPGGTHDGDVGARPSIAAHRLLAARTARTTLTGGLGELSLAEAYAIQDELTAARVARGEHIVGWKLGYTSLAMRAQMGIDAPNRGPLTDAMLLASGAAVPAAAIQPRVEPEIGLRLERPVPPGASTAEALACCSGAYACLEVVDSIWTDYKFSLTDNTADGSSAAWVVLGPALPMDDLAGLGVVLVVDGAEVASATGAAAGGHPAAGLAWLADELSGSARGLRSGDLVITGGLTAAYPLTGAIAARFGDDVEVSVNSVDHRTRDA